MGETSYLPMRVKNMHMEGLSKNVKHNNKRVKFEFFFFLFFSDMICLFNFSFCITSMYKDKYL